MYKMYVDVLIYACPSYFKRQLSVKEQKLLWLSNASISLLLAVKDTALACSKKERKRNLVWHAVTLIASGDTVR